MTALEHRGAVAGSPSPSVLRDRIAGFDRSDRSPVPDSARGLLVVVPAGFGRLDGLYRELANLGWRTTTAELHEPLLHWVARGLAVRPTVGAHRRAFLKIAARLWRTAAAFKYRSRRSGRLLRKHAGGFDCVLQIGGMWAPAWPPSTVPYTLFCDCTVRVADGNSLSGVDFPSPAIAERWYRLERDLYHGAAAIFVASEFVRRSLIEDYGLPGERVVVVGEGINLNAPDDLDHRYDGKTILFVGYEFERKGGPVLLEAFSRIRRDLPDAELLVAGPRHRPDVLPDGVQWLGEVRRGELARLYERASLFVMPSLFEPFGLVYLEAMEWKVPCIGTTECAIPEIIVDGQTGRLVPPGNVEVLAETVIGLLRQPALLKEMGERGRAHARARFTWPQVAQHVDAGLRRVLGHDVR
jgi:glycosyltransferase involved in cell wall biosynthesis